MNGKELLARFAACEGTAQQSSEPEVAHVARQMGRLHPIRCRGACFAHGTLIATPEGTKPIESFAVGETVLAATPDATGDGLQLSWSPGRVVFSAGASADQTVMVYQISTVHSPPHDQGILWDSFGFDWPVTQPCLSDRDQRFPRWADFVSPF